MQNSNKVRSFIFDSYRGVDYYLVQDFNGWYWRLPGGAETSIRTTQGCAESDVREYIRSKVLK